MPSTPPLFNFNDPSSGTGDPIKVAFGSFLRLYDEDSLLRAFNVPGLTRRGLEALLRSLHVPYIEINRTRLVDGFSLFLALRAVLRVGEPDFLAPTSHTRRRGEKRPRRNRVKELNVARLKADWKAVALEVLVAQRANRLRISDRALGAMAATAVTRMIALGHHHAPLRSQQKIAKTELLRLRRDGTLPPWTTDDATPYPPIPDALPSLPASCGDPT